MTTFKWHRVNSKNAKRNAAWRKAHVEVVKVDFGPMGEAFTVRQNEENKSTHGGEGAMHRAFLAADQLSEWRNQ